MRRRGIHGLVGGLLGLVAVPAGFAQLFPSSSADAAKVVKMTGQVTVLRDSQPWALNVGDFVQTRQVIVTGPDGFASFEVSDGSSFEVYPNSNVIFRKNPGNLRDLLDLFVGRVKIHIQKLGAQPNPNRILTPTAVISVRGTTFDVTVDDDDQNTLVEVEEGAVEVRHALKPGQPRVVSAGESLHVYRDEPLARSVINKGEVVRRILHGMGDAAYRIAITAGSHGAGPTCGSGTLCGETPPPPPPNRPPPPGSPVPPAGGPPPP
jgi:ferric-dicitrate binding protein FerR (iron transport regulator)